MSAKMSCFEKFENIFYRIKLEKLAEHLDSVLEREQRCTFRQSKSLQHMKAAFQYLQEHQFEVEKYQEYPARCCFMLLHICFRMRLNDSQLIRDIILYFIRYAENSDTMFCFMDGISFPYDMTKYTIDLKVTYLLELAEKGRLEFKGQRIADFLLFQYVLTNYKRLTNRRLAGLLQYGTRELLTPCIPSTDGEYFASSYSLLELLRYLLWNMNLAGTSCYRQYDADCVRLILRSLWIVPRHVTQGLTLPEEFEDIHDVPKLKHLARCAVRRSLYVGWNLPNGLTKLPFGIFLTRYLKLGAD